MPEDIDWMKQALALAERGRYSVSPNPMVGCVIVKDGRQIGEGFHQRAGLAHAEALALAACTEDPRGATAYVTLAPCNHTGRTPPCAEALVRAGIKRAVAAIDDPNPIGDRSGLDLLREQGIEVELGLLKEEAARLNEKFLFAIRRRVPFVLLKAGMTLDGKLATIGGESQWITSEASRQKSLELREEYDAILVGSGTVNADNPRLTRRLGWNNSVTPWLRVILDSDAIVSPAAAAVSDGNPTLLYTSDPQRIEPRDNLEILKVHERMKLRALLSDLYSRGIHSLLVEGGPQVHSEFIQEALWQKMVLFIAPMFVGGGDAPAILQRSGVSALSEAHRFRFDSAEMVGSDLMITSYPT